MRNYKAIKTQEDFEKFYDRLTNAEVRECLWELIQAVNEKQEPLQKIAITQEQLDLFFNVKNPDERRGRKPVIITAEDREAQKERVRQYQRERYHKTKVSE